MRRATLGAAGWRRSQQLGIHGAQISTTNTGFGAYFDTSLGRTLVSGDLTRHTGSHYISDFTGGVGGTAGSPVVVSKIDVDDVSWDVPYVTLRASNVRSFASAYLNGTHQRGARLEWVTVDATAPGAQGMQYESWSAYRSQFRGNSDGVHAEGGTDPVTMTECYLGVKMASNADHNDCLQNVGGSGVVNLVRCYLESAPEGGIITGGAGGPNSCIQSADMVSGSVFHLSAQDCFFDGSTCAYTVRLYDGGLTPNITYSVIGCQWARTSAGPVDRGTANTTPLSQIVWSNNTWADTGSLIPLT